MTISAKVIEKKKQKETALYNAAYELFITKGINETAILDIVKRAGVAKGTFYLYFKDKYDVLERIIITKSGELIEKAFIQMRDKTYESPEESILDFIDLIIESLRENAFLLKLIHKNLSWGLYKKALKSKDAISVLDGIKSDIRVLNKSRFNDEELEKVVFLIIEITSSTAYSCIVRKEPSDIDEMKPILYMMIKRMLRPIN